jgi:hypothetical protein
VAVHSFCGHSEWTSFFVRICSSETTAVFISECSSASERWSLNCLVSSQFHFQCTCWFAVFPPPPLHLQGTHPVVAAATPWPTEVPFLSALARCFVSLDSLRAGKRALEGVDLALRREGNKGPAGGDESSADVPRRCPDSLHQARAVQRATEQGANNDHGRLGSRRVRCSPAMIAIATTR